VGELKPCKVCKLHGVRIRIIDGAEFVSCANDACIIYGINVPVEKWQSASYKAVVTQRAKLRNYKKTVEVKDE
jgi:hypothetical protein